MAPTEEFDNAVNSGKVISPKALCHVVLRTSNLKPMLAFYLEFLGGRIAYANEMLAFITYDEEHHRIALLEIPGTEDKISTSCGLEHIAFGFSTLYELFLSYRQRLKAGIKPHWCVNHGPTTSIYYKDPDGNMLETQVDNFDTIQEADEFMKTRSFSENPIGADFDPEDLIRRFFAGEADSSLKRRIEIGPRQPDATILS
ncbi:hypothetical protein LTR84_007138 [Exophiala bonariae]|uniref:VOC domain-containing protein n=1 Tax=Exophiala bonariae TaxID=1690606 RepID=A0AAV9MYH1_9EURO|nr:hypothetical protein LTR84_007138 [Exophiala bonariae]